MKLDVESGIYDSHSCQSPCCRSAEQSIPVIVQIEHDKYPGSFHNLRFGEKIPFTGSCYRGQLDLFYYRDPGVKAGKSFPLWTIQ
jgi:hypothetical protein